MIRFICIEQCIRNMSNNFLRIKECIYDIFCLCHAVAETMTCVFPYPGTEAWVKSIGYQDLDRWRPWYFGEQVAGYAELCPFFALPPL